MRALCEVEGGPIYEVEVRGQASVMQYELSTRVIDFGRVQYDQVAQAALVIINRGSVAFQYRALDLPGAPQGDTANATDAEGLQPGQPVIVPNEVFLYFIA